MANARYEFALKVGGFARLGKIRGAAAEAKADAKEFAKALPQDFVARAGGALAKSCERLLFSSPCELVIIQGQVMWQLFPATARGTSPDDLLLSIRQLRNSLFHGNESSGVQGYLPDQLELLLRDAVAVLEACVAMVPTVAKAYAGATL